ncbi:hypothetical protein PMI36_03128 [Pseudomonas sp. GM79]|uniref:hypothetical protein n=1 Tax=Pseudomonas sp. GM79 TaxID=1144338 RepID=UPI00026F61D9|nr:hypothetical protein [Pseudomonas sp. GM79]EJN22647.1 hypothetical protein PMI36_03128 [Pseudomonas sp. GM79]
MSILERLQKERARAKLNQQETLTFEMTEEEFEVLESLVAMGNGGDVVNNGLKPNSPPPSVKIMVNGMLRELSG